MPNITRKGQQLSDLLKPYIGATVDILETCSLIARHSRSYAAYRVAGCNRPLSPAEDARVEWLESHLAKLVGRLPRTSAGAILLSVGGDPRGYNVKLVLPETYRAGNTWGGWQSGFGVPGS